MSKRISIFSMCKWLWDVYVQLAGVIWPWPSFHGSVVKAKFLGFGLFLILYRSTLFGVWKYFMMNMSVWQIYLILTSFLHSFLCVGVFVYWSVFHKLWTEGQLNLLYGWIVRSICLSDSYHLTFTWMSWLIGQCLVSWLNLFLRNYKQ